MNIADTKLDAYAVTGSSPPASDPNVEDEPLVNGWGRDGLLLLIPADERSDPDDIEMLVVSQVCDLDVLSELQKGCTLVTFDELFSRLDLTHCPWSLIESWHRAKHRFLTALGTPPCPPCDADEVVLGSVALTTETQTGERLHRSTACLDDDEVINGLHQGGRLLTFAELVAQVYEKQGLWPTEPLAEACHLDAWDARIAYLLSKARRARR